MGAMMQEARLVVGGGQEYVLMLATIEDTHLGWCPDGFYRGYRFWLTFDYASSGVQGGGFRMLGVHPGSGDRELWKGDADAMSMVFRILETVGVDTWEHLRGARCYVLRGGTRFQEDVLGIARVQHPDLHYLLWHEEKPALSEPAEARGGE